MYGINNSVRGRDLHAANGPAKGRRRFKMRAARKQTHTWHSSLFTPQSSFRAAFTLIEVLVAMAVTMIMLGIVVTIFGMVETNVSASLAGIEMEYELRAAKHRLQLDLAGVTAQMLPPRRPEYGEGYFEIIEGPVGMLPPNTVFVPNENYDPTQAATSPTNIASMGSDTTVGDNDDILMFTTGRTKTEPYLGRARLWNSATGTAVDTAIQSNVAEVAWFLRGTTLYRRQLLVRPDLNYPAGQLLQLQPATAGPPYATLTSPSIPTSFYNIFDLSVHASGVGYDTSPAPPGFGIIPNSLGDLTNRENRFAHRPLIAGSALPDNVVHGWPHDVRNWGIFFSATPYGQSVLAGLGYPTLGCLGLPTLAECTSPNWYLPGTVDLASPFAQQVALGDANGHGMSAGNTLAEQFDAWNLVPSPLIASLGGTIPASRSNPPFNAVLGPRSASPLGTSIDPSTGTIVRFGSNVANQSRIGEDIVLTNVLSFDVKVWDSTAWIIAANRSHDGKRQDLHAR